MELVDPQDELRALVQSTGSQQSLAKRLGISDAHVSHLLSGKRTFTKKVLQKLGLRYVVVRAES